MNQIPIEFKFVHFEDPSFIYRASKEGEKYIIEWESDGLIESNVFSEKDVQRYINEKIWIIIQN